MYWEFEAKRCDVGPKLPFLSAPTVLTAEVSASSKTRAPRQPVSGGKLPCTHAWVNPSEADIPSPSA